MRTETRSVTIAAAPAEVLRFVADPVNLPRWAPAFARSVQHRDGRWFVSSDRGEFEIVVVASAELGTFDLWPAADPRRGIRTRVIANCDGSEYVFTLLLDDDIDDAARARQVEVIEQELSAVRELVQGR
jgi:Polyketide cyclase / dehydrase and lipid transport